MYPLTEKELNSTHKLLKPDFNQRTGRELLAFYLQTKFKQILAHDKKFQTPVFIEVRPDFISKFSRRIINNPTKRFLIGITGESASGKSTYCREIQRVISEKVMPVTVLSTDNYFNDISSLISEYGSFDNLRDNGYDVDSPESFQLEILKRDLEKLSEGQDIKSPQYLPNGTGICVPDAIDVPSQKIIVVEGMASMYKDVKDLFDIKIYIEAKSETRKQRFLKRAHEERNQDMENALKHWDYITIAGENYVKPSRATADFVLNGEADLNYFCEILDYIHTVTNNFQ